MRIRHVDSGVGRTREERRNKSRRRGDEKLKDEDWKEGRTRGPGGGMKERYGK